MVFKKNADWLENLKKISTPVVFYKALTIIDLLLLIVPLQTYLRNLFLIYFSKSLEVYNLSLSLQRFLKNSLLNSNFR